ncbi:MAG: ribosomal protein S18-alanine N-acetyltransferase [bacterium]
MIRLATAADVPVVVAIDAADRPAPRDESLFSAALATPGCALHVLEREGRVVGFAETRVVLDEAWLVDIAVEPAWRGQGLGRCFLRFLLDDVAARGAESLGLEVRRDNTVAQKLYESMGMQKIGRRRRYYADGEDAVLYQVSVVGPAGG